MAASAPAAAAIRSASATYRATARAEFTATRRNLVATIGLGRPAVGLPPGSPMEEADDVVDLGPMFDQEGVHDIYRS